MYVNLSENWAFIFRFVCNRTQDFSRSCANDLEYNDSSLFVNNLGKLDRNVIRAQWFSGYSGILTKTVSVENNGYKNNRW